MNDPDHRRSPDGCDDDAIFADIVAHLNDDVAAAEPTTGTAPDEATTVAEPAEEATGSDRESAGSASEDPGRGSEASGSSAEPATGSTDLPPGIRPEGSPAQWPMNPWPKNPWPKNGSVDPPAESNDPAPAAPQAWRGHEVDDEDEEHFEPPPVTPLPAGDLAFWGILAGMGGGPLLLLYLVFFNRDAGGYWILAAIAMSVGGFAMLVSRMPGHHDEDDDGARL